MQTGLRNLFFHILSVFCLIGLFFAIPYSSYSAQANSAPTHVSAKSQNGLAITLDDCPIEVKKEVLTFDIPSLHIYVGETYRGYNEPTDSPAMVTAEYTFYNPTDMEISVRAVFPLDIRCDGISCSSDEYNITLDGEIITKQLRASYVSSATVNFRYYFPDLYSNNNAYAKEFDYKTDVQKISGRLLSSELFSPDTVIYRYDCQVDCENTCCPFLPDIERGVLFSTGECKINGSRIDTTQKSFTLYSLKEVDLSEIELFTDATKATKLSGSLIVNKTSQTLFDTLVESSPFTQYPDTDKYNLGFPIFCTMHEMQDSYYNPEEYDKYDNVFEWYEFSMNFAPYQTRINSVQAPMYSGADLTTSPYTYTYTYLWSPARNWASFNDLTVNINTPYYYQNSSYYYPATKTDNGYTFHLDTLPEDSELKFCLCEVEEPEERYNYNFTSYTFDIGSLSIPYWIIVAIIMLVFFILKIIVIVKVPFPAWGKILLGIFLFIVLPILVLLLLMWFIYFL